MKRVSEENKIKLQTIKEDIDVTMDQISEYAKRKNKLITEVNEITMRFKEQNT